MPRTDKQQRLADSWTLGWESFPRGPVALGWDGWPSPVVTAEPPAFLLCHCPRRHVRSRSGAAGGGGDETKESGSAATGMGGERMPRTARIVWLFELSSQPLPSQGFHSQTKGSGPPKGRQSMSVKIPARDWAPRRVRGDWVTCRHGRRVQTSMDRLAAPSVSQGRLPGGRSAFFTSQPQRPGCCAPGGSGRCPARGGSGRPRGAQPGRPRRAGLGLQPQWRRVAPRGGRCSSGEAGGAGQSPRLLGVPE